MLLTDIDDRKRAEGELTRAFDEVAKSEAELRTIIDAYLSSSFRKVGSEHFGYFLGRSVSFTTRAAKRWLLRLG
jgi:hypothetical protein